jgi:hypothetical protein
MEDSKIPDDAITASSVLDDGHAASSCRLNAKAEGEKKGAWAAKDNDENQWLQVNLGQCARLSKISTQGENGESTNHVKSYSLSYSRDGENFISYDDKVSKA